MVVQFFCGKNNIYVCLLEKKILILRGILETLYNKAKKKHYYYLKLS